MANTSRQNIAKIIFTVTATKYTVRYAPVAFSSSPWTATHVRYSAQGLRVLIQEHQMYFTLWPAATIMQKTGRYSKKRQFERYLAAENL